MLKYYAFRFAAAIVPLMPLTLGYWLASLFGDIGYLFQSQARRNVHNNLRRVLGPKASDSELNRLTREVFRNAAKNYYDLFRIPKLTLEQVRQSIEVDGLDNIDRGLERGKGVIFVAPHLGSFDLVAQIAAVYSYKVTIPVERLEPQQLFDLISRTRSAKGINLVAVGGSATKAIYRALGNNEVVAIAADRDVMHNGIRLKFFGEETTVPYAPAVFALRTGANVVVGCAVRTGNGTYAIHVVPLALQITGDAKQDIRVNSELITRILENFIRRFPDQWVAFDSIWNNN